MLTARPLSIWDAGFCWRLANDPAVRESAVDRTAPTRWGHAKWMLAWLFKRDRQAWVIGDRWPRRVPTIAGTCVRQVTSPAGLARVQRDGTVSIEVLGWYRHQGVGLFGILVATEFAHAHKWDTPTAHIRADNKPSIGLFARAGYEMAGATDGWCRMERTA